MGNEKYTQKVIEAFQTAQQIAALHYNQEITSVHVLMGLVKEPEGLLSTIFTECGTDVPMLQARLEQLLKKIPSVQGQSQMSMAVEMARVIGKAQQYAESMHDEYISTEHLLLGIAEESDSDVQNLCREFGLVKDKIMSAIRKNRKQNVNSDNPESNYKALEKYGRDLTAAARKGKLDPVIGRDDEIRRTYRIRTMDDVRGRLDIRGGTAYSPVFAYANTQRVDLVVYFTDGKGEEKLQTPPKGYKVLWVLSGKGDKLSLKKPFGLVKRLTKLPEYDPSIDFDDVEKGGFSMNHQEGISMP